MSTHIGLDIALSEGLYYRHLGKIEHPEECFCNFPFGSSSPKRAEESHKAESDGHTHSRRPATISSFVSKKKKGPAKYNSNPSRSFQEGVGQKAPQQRKEKKKETTVNTESVKPSTAFCKTRSQQQDRNTPLRTTRFNMRLPAPSVRRFFTNEVDAEQT